MSSRALLVCLVMLAACDGRERPPRLPPQDGGGWTGRVDAAVIVRRDAGPEVDAGPHDAGSDAGSDGGSDAGVPIAIDGTIGEAEWASALEVASDTIPTTAFAANSLRRMLAVRDDVALYLAIEGRITAGNAFLVYVDRDLAGLSGVPSGTPLEDFTGQLDRALTKLIFADELYLDAAWGSLDLERVASADDDRMGWRDVSGASVFSPLTGASACGPDGCETRIALDELGVGAADTIAIFARLGSATTDAISNQTLPMDDPSTPDVVSTFVMLPP